MIVPCYSAFCDDVGISCTNGGRTPAGSRRYREIAMQTANVKWIGDERFVATGPSGHAVTIDSDRKSNTAMGPMEMLLMALGACTATDIVIILKKKRQKLES